MECGLFSCSSTGFLFLQLSSAACLCLSTTESAGHSITLAPLSVSRAGVKELDLSYNLLADWKVSGTSVLSLPALQASSTLHSSAFSSTRLLELSDTTRIHNVVSFYTSPHTLLWSPQCGIPRYCQQDMSVVVAALPAVTSPNLRRSCACFPGLHLSHPQIPGLHPPPTPSPGSDGNQPHDRPSPP